MPKSGLSILQMVRLAGCIRHSHTSPTRSIKVLGIQRHIQQIYYYHNLPVYTDSSGALLNVPEFMLESSRDTGIGRSSVVLTLHVINSVVI